MSELSNNFDKMPFEIEKINVEDKDREDGENKEMKIFSESYLNHKKTEELIDGIFESIKKIDDLFWMKSILQKLELSDGYSEFELKIALEKYIGGYIEKISEIEEIANMQLKNIQLWLEQNKINPKQNPQGIKLFVTDPLIDIGIKDDKPIAETSFDYKRNSVVVDTESCDPSIVVHEFIHGMAYDKSNKRNGFKKIDDHGNISGNQWLDEGTTMFIELEILKDKSFPTRESAEIYVTGFAWLAEKIISEIGSNKDELFRAYFGEEPIRSVFEKKFRKRFNGHNIEDLDCLFIGCDEGCKQQTIKIIEGKKVTLQSMKGSGLDESHKEIARIFPNVELDIRESNQINY